MDRTGTFCQSRRDLEKSAAFHFTRRARTHGTGDARAMGGGDAPRGGTRGGKDQFNWDDVKGDKDREYYLGHSLKASVGRWQRGKDILWYTREKEKDGGAQMSDADRAKAEIAAIKAAEEQSMAEALGLKPRTEHHVTHATLEKHEMDELLRRGTTKDERTDDVDAARVKGLGVQGIAGQHGGAGREIMEGVGLSDDEEDERRRAAIGQKRSREMVEVPPPPRAPLRMTDKELRKEKKRAKKEAKKAKKRAKKEAKRAKKDAKRRAVRPRRRPHPRLESTLILGLKTTNSYHVRSFCRSTTASTSSSASLVAAH